MSRAYVGDEVFFHHNGTPKTGSVIATGKHGCTIKDGDKTHKVKWECLSGHKKRTKQSYTVDVLGEDGMIIKSGDGSRRFVAIPPESKAEQYALQDKKVKKNSPS